MKIIKATTESPIVIDAKGKTLGRLATEVAVLLQGKDKATWMPNKDEGHAVEIENVKEVEVTGKKMTDKLYYHHSRYPGGLKTRSLTELWQKDPADVLKRAVYGMLPKNKLRNDRMKRLTIKK
ncbi:MAG: 50S ribosomal protein L13 [Candidatus Spechtbacteria bacterium]|nr:50S ribosomal protein L13 [Candidatus Spechtbacteria bacterium]